MCGIAGAIGAIDGEVRGAVARMSDAQAHRGPDQSGIWSSVAERGAGVVFGHRRLSILDLSEAGRQPMQDPRTGAVIVFNGEVYNFATIREELGPLDWVSSTDTEVVLKAYARLGEEVITRDVLREVFHIDAEIGKDPRTGKPMCLTYNLIKGEDAYEENLAVAARTGTVS